MKKVLQQINMLEEVKETLKEAKYIFDQYCSRSEHYVDYHRYYFPEDKDNYENIDDELLPLLDKTKQIKKERIEIIHDLSKIRYIICNFIPKFHWITYKNKNCIKTVLPLYYYIMHKYHVENCNVQCSNKKLCELEERNFNFCVFQELNEIKKNF